MAKFEEETMSIQDAYLVMQKASGIEVGNKVRVLRKASTEEMGWDNSWPDSMDKYVREIGKVEMVYEKASECRSAVIRGTSRSSC